MAVKIKGGTWIVITTLAQLTALFVFNHLFTTQIDAEIRSIETSLHNSGMSIEQASVVALSIHSIKNSISIFILGLGITIIMVNQMMFRYLINRNQP